MLFAVLCVGGRRRCLPLKHGLDKCWTEFGVNDFVLMDIDCST